MHAYIETSAFAGISYARELAAVDDVPALSRPECGADRVCVRAAVADDEEASIGNGVAVGLPHRSSQRVAPAAHHDFGVDPGDGASKANTRAAAATGSSTMCMLPVAVGPPV
jgi:hypothetical protein